MPASASRLRIGSVGPVTTAAFARTVSMLSGMIRPGLPSPLRNLRPLIVASSRSAPSSVRARTAASSTAPECPQAIRAGSAVLAWNRCPRGGTCFRALAARRARPGTGFVKRSTQPLCTTETFDAAVDWRALHGDAFEGVRVVVTGGAGFIGSHLVEALVSLGAQVVAIDDLSGGDWANLDGFGASVERITASILDAERLGEAVAGSRYVFHQAALGSVPRSIKQPHRYFDVNFRGTLRVIEVSQRAGVGRLLFASSSSIYGNPPDDAAKREGMPLVPLSPYAATKACCEIALRTWTDSYDFDTVSLRYFNIFGPRQNANSAYAAVVAAFAKALHAGGQATIFGDGDQSRDFTYVANAVHANLLAARCGDDIRGSVFNVACGGSVSVNALYGHMAQLLDYTGPAPQHAPPRVGEVRSSRADLGAANAGIGYEPIVGFAPGMAETVRWYRAHLGPPAGPSEPDA